MSDRRSRRERSDKDPVFEEDDWAKGVGAYKRYVERLKRERDEAPGQDWQAYKARERYRAEQKDKKTKHDKPSDEEDYSKYAEVMAKYKREFKLFIQDKRDLPPKKPPWMWDNKSDKGAGMGDYIDKDSDAQLSISENESLGSAESEDKGPPQSVPSWAKSKGSSKDQEKVPTKAKTDSVRSRSTGGEVKEVTRKDSSS